MIFRGFFDGGNQPNSEEYDVITLASVSGTKDQWRPFEDAWRDNLKTHGAKWLHTTDALTLNAPFTITDGWTKAKVEAFLSSCVDVIEEHATIPKKKGGLIPYVLAFVLKDFIYFAAQNPDKISSDVTEVCATQAVDRVIRQGLKNGAHFFHLVFDQNEPFIGHISQRQINKKAKKRLKDVNDRITSITEANMRVTPALQMADLFAWCFSHKFIKPQHSWQERLLKQSPWIEDWYGEKELKRYLKPEYYQEVKAWKLPPRKPTR